MLDIGTALKVLKSFGYDSSSIPPYIYVDENNIGICYSFFDDLYGNLDRVSIFTNQTEMETFLKKFDWYKMNSEKYNISIKLDNYEIINPKVIYIYDDEAINYDGMQRLEIDDYLSTKQKGVYINAINGLIALYENVKNKNDQILAQVLISECELENLRNSIQQLKNTFKKIKFAKTNPLTPETIIPELDYKIPVMQNDLTKITQGNSKKEFENLLDIVLHNLKMKEKEEGNLNAKFHLKELILNTKALAIQQEEFTRLVDASKRLFANKAELNYHFDELEKQDIIQILPIPELIAREKNLIDTKYKFLKDLPLNQITHFLDKANEQTLENLSMLHQELLKETKKTEKEKSKEEIFADLTRQYNNLEPDIIRALMLYNSPLRKMFDYLFQIKGYDGLRVEELIRELETIPEYNQEKDYFLGEFNKIINYVDNVSIKHLYFSVINFNSHEEFIISLVSQMKIIKIASHKLTMNDDLKNVYFALTPDKPDLSILTPMTLTNASVFRYLNETDNHVVIATLKKDSSVIIIPKQIKLSDTEEELIVRECLHLEIFINTKGILARKTGENKCVAKYRSIQNDNEKYDIIITTRMDLIFKNTYGIAEVTTNQNYEMLDI